jgi:ssDNA-binding replication factor A large subunit
VHREPAPLPVAGLGDDLDVVPRTQLVLVGDVIRVRMGAKNRSRGRPQRSAAATSGPTSAPESTKSAVPPSRSAITKEFDSQSGCMLFSISTALG